MYKIITILFISLFCLSSVSHASVTFITETKGNYISSSPNKKTQSISIAQTCYEQGYIRKSVCPKGKVATNRCPEDSRYFEDCCDTYFNQTEDTCYNLGLEPSKQSCAGLHYCE